MRSDVIEQKKRTILKLTSILDQLFLVLEDFRQNLNDFQKSCQCVENHKNKLNFNELEDIYNTFVEEYIQKKSEIDDELGINSELNESSIDAIHCEYEDCVFKTSTKKNMSNHVGRMHLNKSKIKCTECEFLCWGTARLTEHMTSVHNKSKDKISGKRHSSSLKTNHSSHSDNDTNSTEPQNSETIESTSDPKNDIECEYEDCVYKASKEKNMMDHIRRMHLKKSRIQCTECQFQCWGSTRLKEHVISAHPHIDSTKQKSYKNHFLGLKTDVSTDSRNRSRRSAFGSNSTQTPNSNSFGYSFNSVAENNLNDNICETMESTSGSKNARNDTSCEYKDCVYKASKEKNMLNHIRRMHWNKSRLKCPKCQFKCWGISRLTEHMKAIHSIDSSNRHSSDGNQELPPTISFDSMSSFSNYFIRN